MKLDFDKLTADDFEVFLYFFQETNQYHAQYEPYKFKENLAVNEAKSFFDKYIIDPNFISLKCIFEAKVIGIIYGCKIDFKGDLFLKERSFILIQQISVLETFRGQGIGKMLLNKFEENVARFGDIDIELMVWEFNETAANLYEKNGYRKVISRMKKEIINPKNMSNKPTLVIGASENTERYSNKAMNMLLNHHHTVFGFGNKAGMVRDIEIFTEEKHVEVDTVTLYLSPKNQDSVKDYIFKLNPKRVIFNPGTENPEFENELNEKGISTEEACTLVLLQTNQY